MVLPVARVQMDIVWLLGWDNVMRYALIKKGKVENVIIADAEFIKHLASKYDYIENIDGKRAGPGCSYDPVNRTFGSPSPPLSLSLEEARAHALSHIAAITEAINAATDIDEVEKISLILQASKKQISQLNQEVVK